MNKNDVIQLQNDVLNSMLPHISFDGWAWETALSAVQGLGHDERVLRAIFPAGLIDVMDGFALMADREMLNFLSDQNPNDMRVRDRVREATLARFAFLGEHKDAFRQALAFWAVPTRKIRAGKIVWRTADTIWNWAGDTSVDYNHYTKRALLSGVLVSTTLAWVDDEAQDMALTRAFLDRRIANVMTIGKFTGRVKAMADKMPFKMRAAS